MSTTPYKVQNGDCLESIAQKHGFFHETLWNLDENAGLKRQRKDPNILLPGDIVYIPEVDPAKMSRANDQRHTFRRKGVPSKFHMRFMRHGKPRANIPYLVRIDGRDTRGKTDKGGWVHATMTPQATEALVQLWPESDQPPEEYVFALGSLDPIDTVTGQKSRLASLGRFGGAITPDKTQDFKDAIAAYQEARGLSVTGTADTATQNKLKEEHGS
jgi:hypothetical protein